MRSYRNENHRFEIQIPDEWFLIAENAVGPGEYSILFQCRHQEAFNIQFGPIFPESSLEETESNFTAYSQRQGYTSLTFGRIQAGGKTHVWARYYAGGGTWFKKYMLVFDHVEYAITATCFEQSLLLEMEKSWDAVISTFRSFSASTFDLDQIMQTLARPAALTEMPRRIELCQLALAHVNRRQDPETWAGLQIELAKNLAQNPQGDRVQKIEQAIMHNQNALEVFTRETYPEFWANIQINLASNHRNRLCGDRAENIEESIRYCLQALEVLNIREYPLLWANAHNNLANSYRDRLQGDRADNIEQCIHHCRQALVVFTRHTLPVQWATVQNNLGNAYRDRLQGERESNLEEALECYQQALQVFTHANYAEDWAWTQINLGATYKMRVRGNTAQNIELSIQHSTQALQVFNKDSHPEKWALAHLNLANAYTLRQFGKLMDNLKQALENYQQALTVITQQAHPEYWDKAQLGLATVNQLLLSLQPPASARASSASGPMETFPKLTYPDLYKLSLQQSKGEKCRLQLIYADVPDIKYAISMLLVYQWDGELSSEEADRLRLRAAVYLASAIYDVASYTGVPCELSPFRNGQRHAWMIAGEVSPISVTLSDADRSDRTLQISIGPMVVSMQRLPINKVPLKKLMQGFQEKFTQITV